MSVTSAAEEASEQTFKVIEQDEVVVRFAGDSGDGMQLAGTQMTNTSAIFGNEVSTMPDYPAEIRAPAGTVAGVSGFQLHFSSRPLRTPGDRLDALVAMNPAALEANIADLEKGGILIVNEDAFTKNNLKKAGLQSNPLEDDSLREYRVHRIPIEKLNGEACKDTGLTPRAAGRCKNFFALGVVYWLFDRPLEPTLRWIEEKFGTMPAVLDANTKALKAGYYFGETAEMFRSRYTIPKAKLPPGTYRKVSGNQAAAIGLITAARLAGKPLFYGTYPITPASDILHDLSRYKNYDVRTFQAEDEIAAMIAVIGAAYAGAFAATGTSGPGVALKSEGMGLAVMTELPLVVINVQRGGPSTGLPTKTEQADLNQAILGRNGEAPICVLAAASPADCFATVLEAFRIAVRYMTPVMVMSDGYLANGAEAWRIPSVDELPRFEIHHPEAGDEFQPYARNEDLARPWALPGTPGLEHRIGGLEKKDVTGEVCYEPQNHQLMCELRQAKIRKIAETIPPLEVFGEGSGELLVVGWGSTYGSITSAVESCQARGVSVSSVHLRHLEPMPPDLGDILRRFKRVLVPELNLGQLLHRIRSEYLIDAIGFHKIQGKPFMVSEIENKIQELVNGKDES
ncbi:MAG: 2-oxoacid:acceptor oxidoreductase subunit alpha [Phycisphaerales bacterium]|nr:MAG: 2-oxoacid:acceptor oxidoreductase subunit alpha [Phycisphaerales bacterium]